MIKNLIFDFGDVFINLDKLKPYDEFKKLGYPELSSENLAHNERYEIGSINSKQFVSHYCNLSAKDVSEKQVEEAWNSMLVDFPRYRLEFIQELASVKNFKLILLSNTNDSHINWIKKHVPFYIDFKLCFHKFYLSQEIGLRKPNEDIFQFILKDSNIKAEESLFIDDTKANTDTAERLGFKTWNINPETQDVVDLFTVNQHLF